MAEHCAFGGHSLVIHFDVEFISRKISAQRPAHLHSAQRLAHIWPAAKAFNKFTQGDTECFFDNSALIEIATQLEWHRAARTPHAVILIGLCTLGHDERYGSKRQNIVYNCGFAEQALKCWDRRLSAHDAALAFERFQHRSFFTANISAATATYFECERFIRVLNIYAEPTRFGGNSNRLFHRVYGIRIFRAYIDEAFARPAGDTRDDHAFD